MVKRLLLLVYVAYMSTGNLYVVNASPISYDAPLCANRVYLVVSLLLTPAVPLL